MRACKADDSRLTPPGIAREAPATNTRSRRWQMRVELERQSQKAVDVPTRPTPAPQVRRQHVRERPLADERRREERPHPTGPTTLVRSATRPLWAARRC